MIFPSREYDDAVAAACHGTLDDEQAVAMNVLLRSDPDALEEYVDRTELHASLAVSTELFAASTGTTPAEPAKRGSIRSRTPSLHTRRPTAIRRRRPSFWRLGLGATLLAIMGVFAWLAWREHCQIVAVVAATDLAEWTEGRRPGPSLLSSEAIRLRSGRVRLDFASGARLVLEGPGELVVLSAKSARLRHGLAVCEVETSGRGFRLQAGDLTVVDLGTAFGVRLPAAGVSEVHVLSGRVAVETPSGGRCELAQDEAVHGDPKGLTRIPVARSAFAAPARLLPGMAADTERRMGAWRRAKAAITRDAATLACFDFSPRDGMLPNRVAVPSGRASPGVLSGTTPSTGRRPGEDALRFDGETDCVSFDAPGRFSSLTLLAWIRVDTLPREIGALVMSVGGGEQGGDIHWELGRAGGLTLSRYRGKTPRGRGSAWDQVGVSHLLQPGHLGEWVLLATTANGATGDVVHYLNGGEVSRGALPPGDYTLRSTTIGNVQHIPGYALAGAIDELVISRRAYAPEEIRNLYEAGKP